VRQVRLRSVARIVVSNVDKKSVHGELPVRLCNYIDVYYNETIHADLPFMGATATPDQVQQFALRRSDVLLTKDSETPDDIAVPAFVSEELPGVVCGYHLAIVRPDHREVDGRYLYWSLASSVARQQASASAMGITRFGLRQDAIRDMVIQLPPKTEQRAIADYLDRETARIDALVAAHQRIIELISVRFGTWLDYLLNCSEGSGRERSGPWPWSPVRRLARVHGGITLGQTYDAPMRTYPYLRVANVQDGYLNLSDVANIDLPEVLAERFLLADGDILMLEGNGNPENLGRGTLWRREIDPCLHQNHVHAVRADRNLVLPEYLNWVMRTRWARASFTGANEQVSIATLGQAQILDLSVPVPPLSVQARFVDQIDRTAANHSGARNALSRLIELLAERRQALITAAVTGALEIPGVAVA